MRIGIDARLPAYQMGGISRYTIHLVNALADLDDNNEYVVFDSRKVTSDHFPDTQKLTRRALFTPCHHRFERVLLSVELLPDKLDVFHSPDFIPPLRGARRHVITVHDLNFLHYPQFLTEDSRRYYAEQIAWAVSHADHIIADSEHTREDLISLLPLSPSKVTAIHLAADPLFAETVSRATSEAIAKTRATYALECDFLLFVGTIEPRKNLTMLVEAYDRARREYGLVQDLILVGQKGWLYEPVFELIDRLGLNECVRHVTGVGDIELAHLYLSASCLVLPSHYEGFGLPALEAMHCRCPVLSSDRASLPEVVGDGGVLLPADDVGLWASKLAEISQDTQLREQLIRAGLKQAQQFSWRETALKTRSIYETVARD